MNRLITHTFMSFENVCYTANKLDCQHIAVIKHVFVPLPNSKLGIRCWFNKQPIWLMIWALEKCQYVNSFTVLVWKFNNAVQSLPVATFSFPHLHCQPWRAEPRDPEGRIDGFLIRAFNGVPKSSIFDESLAVSVQAVWWLKKLHILVIKNFWCPRQSFKNGYMMIFFDFTF